MTNLSLEEHLLKYWKTIDRHSINAAKMCLQSRIRDNKAWLRYGLHPEDRTIFMRDLRRIYKALSQCINH